MPTKSECQKIIFNLGIKHGISPKLIATKLLSEDDKNEMIFGELTADTLECAIVAWKSAGMEDCVKQG